MPEKLTQLLQKLWQHLSLHRKRQFALLLALMVLASFAEILSIGSVLPFLAVLTDPNRIFVMSAIQPLLQWLNISSSNQLLMPLTIMFCISTILAAVIRLILLRSSLFLSAAVGSDMGFDMYQRTLYQPYSVHIARNTSDVIDGITTKSIAIANGIVMPLLYIASSAIMVLIIVSSLLIFTIKITLIAFTVFGLIYFFCCLIIIQKFFL